MSHPSIGGRYCETICLTYDIFFVSIEVKEDFFEMLGEKMINFDTFSSSDGVFLCA